MNQKSEYWKGDIGVMVDQNTKKIQVKNIQKGTVSLGIADIGNTTLYTKDKLYIVQYRCHVDIAPWKDRWNLEEFRPNVGYVRTLATLCNP